MAAESVLECRGLRRRFGDIVAVDGVGFHIVPGETYGLLGPNGAGKTTSISMIAGLLERDAGEVLVAGEPMTTRSVRAKNAIGYVPQDLAIYPDLTGREHLMFFARLYSMPTPAAKRRTDEVLALTGLADRAGDQTKQYSGGMKRQAALLGAARFAVAQHAALSFGAGLAQATRISPAVPAVSVTQATAGTAQFSRTLGQF